MKSGLEGRNNDAVADGVPARDGGVSMKSGLEGRNNDVGRAYATPLRIVSMKSGLEGRNNETAPPGQGRFLLSQ